MEKTIETFLKNFIEENLAGANEQLASCIAEYENDGEFDDESAQIGSVATFQERGVLTRDKGLVVSLSDGSEIYITIQVQ